MGVWFRDIEVRGGRQILSQQPVRIRFSKISLLLSCPQITIRRYDLG